MAESKLTVKAFLQLSLRHYQAHDDKRDRARLDIKSAKIIATRNVKITKKGLVASDAKIKSARIEFMVRSRPISYTPPDKKNHYYPITIILEDVAKGVDSPMRLREGSLKKPVVPPAGSSTHARDAAWVKNRNNGVQLQAFFETQWVFRKYNALYGVLWAKKPPQQTNPRKFVYVSKHTFYIMRKYLLPMLKSGSLLRKLEEEEAAT